MLVNSICYMEGPYRDTVARVCAFIMYISVSTHVLKRTEVRYCVVDDCITLDPYRIVWPERLYRVSGTDRILSRRQRFCLVRTNNDMMEITMVTIPYDGVFIVFHTMPFTLPYIIPFTSVLIHECRMNRITQDNRFVFDDILADEGRIVLVQFRNNGQISFNDTVATACCSIVDMSEVSLFPNCIWLNTTDDKR